MNVLIAVVATLAAVAAGPARQPAAGQPTAFDYHRRVGIPQAERVRRFEEEEASDPRRIVGGSTVDIALHSHQAGVEVTLNSGMFSICGASLLTNTHLLTAAHCWTDGISTVALFTVVLGSSRLFSGGTRINTTAVITHEHYSPFSVENDIGIIYIPWVEYTNNIQPIRLPSGSEELNSFAGAFAVASGFGKTSDAQTEIAEVTLLYHVDLQIISNDVCRASFDPFVFDSTLCANGVAGSGTCGGDSGGPLTIVSGGSRVLVGVTSFGGFYCEADFPSAFARVTYYLPWIRQRIQQ